MTEASPTALRFACEARIAAASSPTGEEYPLPIRNEPGSVVVSEDMDRDNFIEVVLTMDWLDEDVIAALDPREAAIGAGNIGPILFRVREYNVSGDEPRAYMPGDVTGIGTAPFIQQYARLWPLNLEQDVINRTVRLTLTSGEAILDDALRIQTTNVNTGATNVAALVDWTLNAVFGATSVTHAAVATATLLPAGDRRIMQPGESHLGVVKSELDAINLRLYDLWGRGWIDQDRDTAAGAAITLATAPGLQFGADPIVYEMTITYSRTGRWADGVLVRFDMTDYGGTVTYQASAGGGASTKGIVISRGRPAPVGNAADKVLARSLTRGKDVDVLARARLDVRTRTTIVIYTMSNYYEGTLRSVEWSFPEGDMRLRVQS